MAEENKCTICNQIISDQDQKDEEMLDPKIYHNLILLEVFKKIISKFSTKYPTQIEKIKSLIPQIEKLDKELVQPKRDK